MLLVGPRQKLLRRRRQTNTYIHLIKHLAPVHDRFVTETNECGYFKYQHKVVNNYRTH